MKLVGIKKKRALALTFLALAFGGTAFYLFLAKIGIPLSELPSVLCLNSCTIEPALHQATSNSKLLNYDRPLAAIIGENPQLVSILVEKSKYRLTVFHKLKPVKSYPIVLGGNPIGDKLAEGDKKTPEGIYRVRSLYPHPSWSKFIWLDYPNSQSWREHKQAKLAGKLNWDSSIGGEIGIHGVPEGSDDLIDNRSNWTLGCVSLKNRDVDEIYQFIGNGTVVEIVS